VEFEPTCTVAVFKDKDKSEELQGRILEEGVPTRTESCAESEDEDGTQCA
jgi:hypothetical protein